MNRKSSKLTGSKEAEAAKELQAPESTMCNRMCIRENDPKYRRWEALPVHPKVGMRACHSSVIYRNF